MKTSTKKAKKATNIKTKKVVAAKMPAKKNIKPAKALAVPKTVKKLAIAAKPIVTEKTKKSAAVASEQILKKAKNLVDEKNTKSNKVKTETVEIAKKAITLEVTEELVPRIQSKAFKENLAKLRALSKVQEYSMGSRYNVGDKLMHAKFGLGEVVDCIEYNKISVHFESGDKILIHNDNRNSLTN